MYAILHFALFGRKKGGFSQRNQEARNVNARGPNESTINMNS